MPINNITQTISTIPPAGARGVDVQTQFVIKQEDFQDHLQGTTVGELNTLKDQLNSRIGEINSTATTMNGYANTSFAGASTATTKAGEASTSASAALTSKNQAGTFATNSSNSATKASQWADNNYNVEVETGRYSAKHWSTVAQNTVNNKIDKVTSTDNAIVRFDGGTGQVQNSGVIIDDGGNLLIGTTTANAPSSGCTFGAIGDIQIAHPAGTASGVVYSYFLYNGLIAGSILQSGTTAVTYNTTSDYRLKENIRPSDCKRFMDIKFVDYERIDGRHECGVIANELQEVYPDLVTGKKDAVEIRKVELTTAVEEVKDEDGNVIVEAIEATYEEQEFPVYQQVNYIGLIARIGTVVQQQAKLIEAIQLEINELKGAK